MPRVSRKPVYKPLIQLTPLPVDEFEGLLMSIATNGVCVPIIVWPKGRTHYIVDGFHRKKIADELGYDCPELIRDDLTAEDARRRLALARRTS